MPDIVDIIVEHAIRAKPVMGKSRPEAELRLVSKTWCASVDPHLVAFFNIFGRGLGWPPCSLERARFDLPAILAREPALVGRIRKLSLELPSPLEALAFRLLVNGPNVTSLHLSGKAVDMIAIAFETSPIGLPRLSRLVLMLVAADSDVAARRRTFLSSLPILEQLCVTFGWSSAGQTLDESGVVKMLADNLLDVPGISLELRCLDSCPATDLAALLRGRRGLSRLSLRLPDYVDFPDLVEMMPSSLEHLSLRCGGPQATKVLIALANPTKLPNLRLGALIDATTYWYTAAAHFGQPQVPPVPNALDIVHAAVAGLLSRSGGVPLSPEQETSFRILGNHLAGKKDESDKWGYNW